MLFVDDRQREPTLPSCGPLRMTYPPFVFQPLGRLITALRPLDFGHHRLCTPSIVQPQSGLQMSQTAVCQTEVETHPILGHGQPFERSNSHYGTFGGLVDDRQYFSDTTSQNFDAQATNSNYGENDSISPGVESGLRIGNLFIDDKVLYLLGACMGVFAVGLNDTATGANLPSIQEHYDLPYAIVSLVFLAGFGGYLISCMLNSVLQNAIGTRLVLLNAIGTRLVLLIAGILYAGGSLLISFAPPFPFVIAGLGLMGFGGGFYEACLTSVVSHFENSRFMNILYAFFGLGA
ncbi:unnamed protein product [Rhizoctonia solani]|uniref:Major facilitator superfamily (MFS) profile domain-containing protein n=1 Tax=Rhizoctonia solani TaxID=456999 RepID=A0A8H3CE41_9AGAM|nr:unnamed protein product [Rhizoctonia solani]